MLKILVLSDINSPHTEKWCKSLLKHDFQVSVYSFTPLRTDWVLAFPEIRIYTLSKAKFGLGKLWYFTSIFELKKLFKKQKPDIVHAHYASSYGLIGALVGYRPLVVSLWGTDVFGFPKMGALNRRIFKWVLKKADAVWSTSKVMQSEALKYVKRAIEVTPFGVDLEKFTSSKSASTVQFITIGTVKSLEDNYGIDILIRAFAQLKGNLLRLKIVGGGSQLKVYQALVASLGITEKVEFTGRVEHTMIPKLLDEIDVFVAVSKEIESFGVAVVEASAMSKPVVVSNVGGLPEVVEHDVTGYVVPAKDVEKTALAIQQLIDQPELRLRLGDNGRKLVEREYQWKNNEAYIMSLYQNIVNKNR